MSETTNYHLFVTDDSSMTFKNVREKVYGEADSNMVKIDAALSEKAEQSQSINMTLPASGWSEGSSPCFQTISVEGLTASQNGVIGVAQDITTQQMEVVCAAELHVSGQSDGAITITANGDRPTCDIPVTIILIG